MPRKKPAPSPGLQQAPVSAAAGRVRMADTRNFPISTEIAAALVEVDPRALCEKSTGILALTNGSTTFPAKGGRRYAPRRRGRAPSTS